ncbi:MAG: polysaccharide export protein [Pegethrix bostrychoides GSE-TBD4-15B]|uniref:Polysaccharide export protein n=1 Tax=Pegethrix bostrychoides GSE-TBD4-15B TaxID=2839662 RepID=A0A951P8W7_9CYAN|nr:polysaccharide export protein [Pegethrix bostrychoides GSE-TBD4-15B]
MNSPAIAQAPILTQPPSPPTELLERARERLRQSPRSPSQLEPSAAFTNYRLGPGDSLFVNVLRFPDLTFQNTIDLEGNLIVPLVGAMTLEGLTLPEAREQIRLALDRYVVNPQVDVILVAQRPVQVTILGEVVRPGLYPLAAPQLSTALISAGGTTALADLRTVRVRRQQDGELAEQDVDLFTPLATASPVPDLQLADGDTIVVPTLTANQGYDRNLAARSTLAQPQIRIRVLNYAAGSRGGGSFGVIQVPNGSSFLDALAASSVDLSNADLRNVALIRFDVQQGRAVARELDGKTAILGDASENPILADNDVIVVGRNLVARVTYALNTFTQPFRDILGFVLFFQSLVDSASNLFQPSGNN